jgi:hypothetical protein
MAGRLGQGSGSVEVDADRYFHNVVGPIFITHDLAQSEEETSAGVLISGSLRYCLSQQSGDRSGVLQETQRSTYSPHRVEWRSGPWASKNLSSQRRLSTDRLRGMPEEGISKAFKFFEIPGGEISG